MQKNGSKIPKGSCEDDPDRSERCYLSMILNDRDMVGLNSPDVGRCFFFVFVFFFEFVQRGRLWSLHWPNLERPEEVLPNAGAGGILVWHGNIWVPSTFSG